ncbi:hypothetical protein SAMN05443248_3388 [Bradyrhizobium erythrophlei]|jgi:hypothetical protein|uniref:Uncharacterized protein n=1 Tax=Bradyrhizobium erythrophlei TaxID=1437360 RepID=A0A1M5PIY9_9BRAD|nr:hypothetical protein SAMN05443248_3388 [Bradyrhizobium erythrophlei]
MTDDMQNNHSLVTAAITHNVIAGLDPAIHHLKKFW